MTKLLTIGIWISTAVRAVVVVVVKFVLLGILSLILFILVSRTAVVAKFVILDISRLTSFILALKVILVAKLVVSGILFSIFFILALYKSFLRISFFTASFSLLKLTGTATSKVSTFQIA